MTTSNLNKFNSYKGKVWHRADLAFGKENYINIYQTQDERYQLPSNSVKYLVTGSTHNDLYGYNIAKGGDVTVFDLGGFYDSFKIKSVKPLSSDDIEIYIKHNHDLVINFLEASHIYHTITVIRQNDGNVDHTIEGLQFDHPEGGIGGIDLYDNPAVQVRPLTSDEPNSLYSGYHHRPNYFDMLHGARFKGGTSKDVYTYTPNMGNKFIQDAGDNGDGDIIKFNMQINLYKDLIYSRQKDGCFKIKFAKYMNINEEITIAAGSNIEYLQQQDYPPIELYGLVKAYEMSEL